ncbi:MAG: hydroxyacid dehydrogenase [Lentisphaerae bacterium]|nr:hydroxyacid dehydrogenase [Lentisphaerota bacterium]
MNSDAVAQTRPRRVAVWLRSAVPAFALTAAQADRLRRVLPGATVTVYDAEDAFARGLADAEMGIAWRFRQAWIDAAPRLQWLATPAAGHDYFQLTLRPGIRVTYGTFHGTLIAETVVAMVLGESRGLMEGIRRQTLGEIWPREALAPRLRSVRGTHAVIIGFGRIGEWVGRLLKPFGIRVTGIRRTPEADPRPFWMGPEDRILPVSHLNAELADADHVILVLPRSFETDRLMDAERLALMPPQAVLYNVGRGNAVDEDALSRALREGRMRAACLDVFSREPVPADSPLLQTPNLYRMPHLAAVAPEYLDHYIDELAGLWRVRCGP